MDESLQGRDRDEDQLEQTPDEQNTDYPTDANQDDQQATMDGGKEDSGFDIDKGKNKFNLMTGAFREGKEAAHRAGHMKLITSPHKPSQTLVDGHNVCHIPYAPWCECCVRARALDNKHPKGLVTKCQEFPVITMDWCYLGQEGEPKTIPVLVVRDSKSKST